MNFSFRENIRDIGTRIKNIVSKENTDRKGRSWIIFAYDVVLYLRDSKFCCNFLEMTISFSNEARYKFDFQISLMVYTQIRNTLRK